ncbi:hypothetical protein Tco_0422302 [Tanacetum coccineum]
MTMIAYSVHSISKACKELAAVKKYIAMMRAHAKTQLRIQTWGFQCRKRAGQKHHDIQTTKLPTPDRDWNKTLPAVHGPVQPWLSNLAREEVGPTFELMKGTCKSLVELEYFFEEVYKATTEQLDWHNPEVIPFDHFINNDLAYLSGGVSSRTYETFITKTKAADYGHIKWIEDLVPNTIWSEVPVNYDKHALWGISHWGRKRQQFYGFDANRESARDVYSKRRIIAVTKLQIVEWHGYKHLDWITVRRDDNKLYTFKEGDFKRLRLQDIKDMLILLVQGKLTNLNVEDRLAFGVSLRMFTRSIIIQRRVEDLQLAYSYPRGFIYLNKDNKNKLMRIDELHKFSNSTLDDVQTALNDRLKGIRMEYLPKTIWRQSDRERAKAMIQAIEKMLKSRRIMRSLEKFVGGRPYEEHAEFDESDTHVLERFETSAGNPVKEILLKLNLPDHRILKDGGEVKEFQRSFCHSDTERLSQSDEVLKLKNFKKDATLKLFKSTNQERFGARVIVRRLARGSDEARYWLVYLSQHYNSWTLLEATWSPMVRGSQLAYEDIDPEANHEAFWMAIYWLTTLVKLQADIDEEERIARAEEEKIDEANIAWDDIQAKVDVDYQLAERLKHFAAKRAEEKRNKPPTKTQQKKTMITYLKNMEGWKHKDLKVNMFMDFRAGEELESTKKQKSPRIVDWKIHKEGKKSYYQIVRADGKSQMYMIFSHMLKSFDREDLEDLHKLVKSRYGFKRTEDRLGFGYYGMILKNYVDPM